MATGRSMQLTKQIGEHLVAAELGRRGYVATPFSGNVPLFDLLAADENGNSIPLQVKAINGKPGNTWQFSDVRKFLKVEVIRKTQYVRGRTPLVNPHLVCIFVVLDPDEKTRRDRFFIFRLRDLQRHFSRTYRGGRRPRNPNAMHCGISPTDLKAYKYEDKRDIVRESLCTTGARKRKV